MTHMTGVSTFREEIKLCFFSVMTCHEKIKLFLCICMNVGKSVIPVMTRHAPAILTECFSFQPASRFALWQSQRKGRQANRQWSRDSDMASLLKPEPVRRTCRFVTE